MASDEECPDGEREREKALGLLLLAIESIGGVDAVSTGSKAKQSACCDSLCDLSPFETQTPRRLFLSRRLKGGDMEPHARKPSQLRSENPLSLAELMKSFLPSLLSQSFP